MRPRRLVINFTNPAGLITEASACWASGLSASATRPAHLCRDVAAALGTRRRLAFEYAGLNHLGWLLGVRGGRPRPARSAACRRSCGWRARAARLFGVSGSASLGAVPNEYLVYYERPDRVVAASKRGRRAARCCSAPRLRSTRASRTIRWPRCGAGASPPTSETAPIWPRRARAATTATAVEDDQPPAGGYEHEALALMLGLHGVRPGVQILDVANQGAMRGLDDTAVVEVPCSVGEAGARPLASPPLPPPAAALVETVKRAERLTIEASRRRSRGPGGGSDRAASAGRTNGAGGIDNGAIWHGFRRWPRCSTESPGARQPPLDPLARGHRRLAAALLNGQ